MGFNLDGALRISARADGEQNVIRLKGNIDRLISSTEALRRNFASAANFAKGFITVATIKHVIDLGDELNDMSIRTGVAVETLSKLKVVAEQNGSSLEELAGSYKFMLRNQSEAIYGSKQAVQSFKQINITVAELKQLSSEDLFLLIAQRVGELGKESDRTKVLMDIFGRSGQQLGVLMSQGAEGIKKAMDEAARLGLVLSKEDAQKMDEFNDKWTVFVNECVRWMQSGFVASFDAFMKLRNTTLGSDIRVPVGDLQGLDQVQTRIESLQKLRKRAQQALKDEDDPRQFAPLQERIAQINSDLDATIKKGMGLYGPVQQAVANPTRKLKGSALDERAEHDRDREIKQMEKYIEKERQQNITLAQQAEYIGMTSVEIEKLTAARQIDAEVAEKTLGMSPQIKAQFEAQAEAVKKQRLEIIQLNYEQSRTFSSGTKKFLSEYVENIGDAASRAKEMWSSAFKGMEDGLTDFITTGKLSFSSFAQSIIKDMIRIQAQQSITGPLAGMLQSLNPFSMSSTQTAIQQSIAANPAIFAEGGIMTGRGKIPLRTYRSGGIANSAQVAIFGEGDVPEAYVPLRDGRSIPVTMKGAGSVVNSVNISISMDGNMQAQGSDASITQFGRLMATTAKSVIMNEMRPGGILAARGA